MSKNTVSLVLNARTAADLMVANPHSLRATATVHDAAAFLIEKGLDAAPAIDDSGRAIGVLSKSDILIHYFEQMKHPFPSDAGNRSIKDLITPAVFAVKPDTEAERVIDELTGLKVGQLFVVGDSGYLVGMIRAQDILNALQPQESE